VDFFPAYRFPKTKGLDPRDVWKMILNNFDETVVHTFKNSDEQQNLNDKNPPNLKSKLLAQPL
jgi:hypothetical protein